MSQLYGTKHSLCNLGAVQVLINLLSSKSIDVQNMSADTLANISKVKKGRKLMRKLGGIPMMVIYRTRDTMIFYSHNVVRIIYTKI